MHLLVYQQPFYIIMLDFSNNNKLIKQKDIMSWTEINHIQGWDFLGLLFFIIHRLATLAAIALSWEGILLEHCWLLLLVWSSLLQLGEATLGLEVSPVLSFLVPSTLSVSSFIWGMHKYFCPNIMSWSCGGQTDPGGGLGRGVLFLLWAISRKTYPKWRIRMLW